MQEEQLAPIPDGFTSVIATRSFDLIEAGVSSKLVVEIGMPAQDVETIDDMVWRCPVRFVNGTSIQVKRACGEDAVQALELALQLVRDEVERLSEDKSRQIFLDGHDVKLFGEYEKIIDFVKYFESRGRQLSEQIHQLEGHDDS